MVNEIKKRPWWKVRRVWGTIIGGTALVVATIPSAPVVVIGAIIITTHTVATALGLIASGVFGYGQGKASERNK